MTHKIDTTYNEQVIAPNPSPRLEPNTQVEIKMMRMHFTAHRQRPLPLAAVSTTPAPATQEKPADTPTYLDHYLFW